MRKGEIGMEVLIGVGLAIVVMGLAFLVMKGQIEIIMFQSIQTALN